MIPKENEQEGRSITGMEVIGVSKLTELIEVAKKIEQEGEKIVWKNHKVSGERNIEVVQRILARSKGRHL